MEGYREMEGAMNGTQMMDGTEREMDGGNRDGNGWCDVQIGILFLLCCPLCPMMTSV